MTGSISKNARGVLDHPSVLFSTEAMRQRRRKTERTKTPPLLGSGSADATEEWAQGDDAATVRVIRAEAQAGQGAVFRDDATRRESTADGAGGDAPSHGGKR